jgi:phosphoribosylanthranilate isomerase
MWLKICGMTSAEAVASAVAAGVDAIGFVFAPSVRRLTPAQAHVLAAPARGRLRCVAVTRHPEQTLIDEILSEFEPDMLQTDIEDFARLRLPATLARLPVVRSAAAPLPLPKRLLFEGAHSGRGEVSDWPGARTLARNSELILAGGLTAHNIGAALRSVRPYGVDTSSGVESAPGVKSVEKIEAFVAAARAAFSENQL